MSVVFAVLELIEAGKKQPPTLQELLEAKHVDPDCRQILKIVDNPQGKFTVDINSLLHRVAPLNGRIQINIPSVYRLVLFNLCHYSTMAGHTKKRFIDDAMRP